MEIFALLDKLEDMLEAIKVMPVLNKGVISQEEKDEMLEIIRDIRIKSPDELKQAKWIKEERERIIAEAEKEAKDILDEADHRIISMINEHEITQKALEKKDDIMAAANEIYRNITGDALKYEDEVFGSIENTILQLAQNLNEVEVKLQNTLETIRNSRKEE